MATNTTSTFQTHNGNNSTATFAISFSFLENTEVDVRVGGVLKTLGTHYNISGSSVTFTSGNIPPSGNGNIRFTRDTDISAKKVDFADGSVLTETDLDNNSDQILFAQQEVINDYVKRDGSQTITGNLVFEGATDDDNETTLAITDPTADRTITVPDITGTLITTADTGTVSNQMIANDAVTNAKIADNQIDSEHYVDGSIDNVHLANDAVNGNKIADDSINSEHYVDGSIDTQHIAADQITSSLIADNQINSEHYVDGSIDRVHLEADIIDGTKLADNAVNTEHIQAGAVKVDEINNGEITAAKLNPSAVITSAEQATATANDTSFLTSAAAEAAFLRQDSSETIASGVTWSASDTKVATTAAIDLRVIELVDNVGGFVPIANETSFPTENPDINTSGTDKSGTIVSVQAASTNLTAQSGTTLTIANGRGTGNAVIITGVSATIPQGFGFLVETTQTDHTYAFHRLVPKASEVSTVAANAVNIAAAGANVVDINNFVDLYQISTSAPTQRADSSSLQIGDLWFDSSSNKVLMIYDGSSGDGFTAATPNASDLININIVAGQLTFQEDLGLITNAVSTGTGNQTLNTVAGIASNVTTVAGIASAVSTVAADGTDIGIVAGKEAEIGRLGTADAVADLAILGTTDVVADMNTLATTAIVSDMDTLADISSNITTVAGIASNVTAVANDATDIGTVAAKATEIGRLGTAAAVADMAILGTTDVVADMNLLATSDVIADMALLATTDVIADMALLATTDVIADMAILATNDVVADLAILATNDVVADLAILGTTDVVADMNILGTSANVTAMSTCATNISNVNSFAATYQIASSAPSTDGAGNSLSAGDLYFDTTANELRVHNGSSFQGGVTATGNLAGLGANTFTGNQTINANIIVSGTVDGRDVAADGTKLDGIEANATADQSNSEIKTAYEANSNTNAFTDALLSKLNAIEASATADQTASEIVSLISGQTIAPNVITTTSLTIDFGSIA